MWWWKWSNDQQVKRLPQSDHNGVDHSQSRFQPRSESSNHALNPVLESTTPSKQPHTNPNLNPELWLDGSLERQRGEWYHFDLTHTSNHTLKTRNPKAQPLDLTRTFTSTFVKIYLIKNDWINWCFGFKLKEKNSKLCEKYPKKRKQSFGWISDAKRSKK